MRSILIGAFCMCTVLAISQESDKPILLSKHEIGLGFNTSNGKSYVPSLHYNFYRREHNILHFSGSFVKNGDFYQAWNVGLWNEYRRYLGQKNKWFFSHGLALSTGHSSFDYSILNGEMYSGYHLGVGYNVGFGYKINDKLSMTSTLKPRFNFSIKDNFKEVEYRKFTSPLTIGINYRF